MFMKKNKKTRTEPSINNLVAKHAHQFNKAVIFKNKNKYQRKAKHKGLEPFFMQYLYYIKKGSQWFQLNTPAHLTSYQPDNPLSLL